MTPDDGSTTCRLCGSQLSDTASLTLDPAPAGAQCFLDDRDAAHGAAIALRIVQCPECALVQSVSPVVDYHRRVITAAGLSSAMRAYRLQQAAAFVGAHGLQGNAVVEIGCHSGYFLHILAEVGLRPHGTEFGGRVGGSGTHPVADIYPEPGVLIPGGPFAAFFCLNFLEHAPDPRGFLRGVRDNLRAGAVGLVEVPNYAQQRRLGRVFDYIADHVSYFDADTIATALTLSGFVVERLHETRHGENLEVWVRRRDRIDLTGDSRLIASTQANLAAWLAQQREMGRRVAVWGASHQALTLLACLMPGAVTGIFDSAPFKQGRYAPVTGLPVLEPTVEALRGVDCVLIVAAGYEREIAATLRGALGFAQAIWEIHGTHLRPVEN